jgi:phosphate-selective porin OprO and OprP
MNSISKALATSAVVGSLISLAGIVREAHAQESAAAPSVGYDKGFFVESADGAFSMKTQARVQFRYTFTSAAVEDPAGDDTRDNASVLTVHRARLAFGGHAFTEDLAYKLQADFGRGSATLKDFYVDYRIAGDALVRFGQYKRPFSRQQITSSGNLELVDRAITDRYYTAGRDVGLTIHNNYEKSPEIEWAVGVFNGAGENQVPADFSPAVVARVGYNQGDVKGYSEADLDGGPLRFGVGASALGFLNDIVVGEATLSGLRSELDYIVKVEGFSSTGGVYFSTVQDGESFGDQTADAIGFHIQAGYTLDKMHQVAGRYSLIAPEAEGAGNQQEASLVYSLYQFGHGFKWQTDVTVGLDEGQDFGDEIQARSQVQLAF